MLWMVRHIMSVLMCVRLMAQPVQHVPPSATFQLLRNSLLQLILFFHTMANKDENAQFTISLSVPISCHLLNCLNGNGKRVLRY